MDIVFRKWETWVVIAGVVLCSASWAFAAEKQKPQDPAAKTLPQDAGGKLIPKEVALDSNKDGKPDRWEFYREDGKLDRIEADSNGDGKPDEIARADESGKLVQSEKDSDFDGKIDQWVKY